METQAHDLESDRWGNTPTRALPTAHPLALLVEKAITPQGLTDTEWRALAPAELRGVGRPIRDARRAYRRFPNPSQADIDHIRRQALDELARTIPDAQKTPQSPLWRVLTARVTAPPRPATGARDFRKALADKLQQKGRR